MLNIGLMVTRLKRLKPWMTKKQGYQSKLSKTLNDLRELGDLAKIKVALQSDDAKNMMMLQGQQAVADQYIAIWKEAHKTTDEMVADLASSVNSNLASTLKTSSRALQQLWMWFSALSLSSGSTVRQRRAWRVHLWPAHPGFP